MAHALGGHCQRGNGWTGCEGGKGGEACEGRDKGIRLTHVELFLGSSFLLTVWMWKSLTYAQWVILVCEVPHRSSTSALAIVEFRFLCRLHTPGLMIIVFRMQCPVHTPTLPNLRWSGCCCRCRLRGAVCHLPIALCSQSGVRMEG